MTPDYIIVGSGPAGCALAARLTEDKGCSVLLLEAGGKDTALKIAMPAALPFVYQDKRLSWNEAAGPEPHLDGLTIDEKRGHVLGGGTSINAMIFNRGNPRDFDGWAAQGLTGWGWQDVLPYFKRMETFAEGASATRGGTGPVHVSRAPARHKMFDLFLRAGEQAGHARPVDHNSGDQEGMHIAQTLIHNGSRMSAPRAYLHPNRHRPNLHLRTGAHVVRVLFDADRAVGVLLADGTRLMAGREVIVAASTIGAAKLLLLSGVGPADELRALGIPVVLDQPNVGRNLENHPGVNLQYSAPHKDSLVAELGPFGQAKLGVEWALFRRGLGASNIFEAGAFLKTHPGADYANVQFEFLPLYRRLIGNKLKVFPGFQMWIDLSRPTSRGHVRLRSANPADTPEIVFNHLQTEDDRLDMIRSVRLARDLFAQPAWDGIRQAEVTPGAEARTDAEILTWAKTAVGTSYHPSGTCRMAVDPAEGVVDGEGRVHGLQGLRVACAAIMPRVVTGNLTATTYMIGEKIADAFRTAKPDPRRDQ